MKSALKSAPRKPYTPRQLGNYPVPALGMTMDVHNTKGRIVEIHPMGTVVVESFDGAQRWQVTGLPFL